MVENNAEKNVIKELWRFMKVREAVSQKELMERLPDTLQISKSKIYFLLHLLSKPIQTDASVVQGKPKAEFCEPLILRIPTVSQSCYWALTEEWHKIKEADVVFEKAKKFYPLRWGK